MTYTQDQLNAITRSYSDEVTRLLEVKANLILAVQIHRGQIVERDKKIELLEKALAPSKVIEPNGGE